MISCFTSKTKCYLKQDMNNNTIIYNIIKKKKTKELTHIIINNKNLVVLTYLGLQLGWDGRVKG